MVKTRWNYSCKQGHVKSCNAAKNFIWPTYQIENIVVVWGENSQNGQVLMEKKELQQTLMSDNLIKGATLSICFQGSLVRDRIEGWIFW